MTKRAAPSWTCAELERVEPNWSGLSRVATVVLIPRTQDFAHKSSCPLRLPRVYHSPRRIVMGMAGSLCAARQTGLAGRGKSEAWMQSATP
jgi:hypothetical protein